MNNSKLVTLIAALPLAISAASIQNASAFSDEFMKWKEQTMTNYQAYKDERDQAFTDFLKKQWKEVDTEEGEIRDVKPKPVDMPIAKPEPVVIKDLPIVQLPERVQPTVPDRVKPEEIIPPAEKPPVTKIPKPSDPIFTSPDPDFEAPIDSKPDFDQLVQEKPDFDDQPIIQTPDPIIEKPIQAEPIQAEPIQAEPIQAEPIDEKPLVKTPEPEVKTPIIEKPIAEKPIFKPQEQTPPKIQPPVIEPSKPIVTTPQPEIPPVVVPAEPNYKGKKYTFDFFGRETTIYADKKLAKRLGSKYNGKTISQGWSDLSLADYEPVLEQLATISKENNLGDWGQVQLAFKFSKALHPNSINNQSFTSWFLLVKQDYQARLAYNSQGVYLLVPAEQSLYEVTFFTFGGKRFYAVSPDGKSRDLGRVFTYDGEYPRAVEPVDMKDPLAFDNERHYKQRKFSFTFERKKYNLSLNVNPSRVNYLASYPQMDIDQYFISPVDTVTANDALDHFRPMVEGKSELEAVNLLLRFVQTSFEYQTDDQQFGYENYLFAEETLTMPASDCEDRSVLFAWLVRELLGLEVVGLDYPGHIAAAVAFSKPVPGDNIAWNGKRFTITDPTYINANAGMTMPEVASHTPKVVAIQ